MTSTSFTRQGVVTLLPTHSSHRPESEGEVHDQISNDNEDEEWQAISYATVCEELEGLVGGVKVGRALREHIQVVESAEDNVYGSHKIEVVAGMVDVFHQVPINHHGRTSSQG